MAHEYFKASEIVNLSTKPVLIYYGMVHLGNALVLACNDGRYSMDKLRKDNRHQGHGLDLCSPTLEKAKKSKNVYDFIKHLAAKMPKNKGQFYLFYKSLNPSKITVQRNVVHNGDEFTYTYAQQSCDQIALSRLVGRKLSAIDLISFLPDMYKCNLEMGKKDIVSLRPGKYLFEQSDVNVPTNFVDLMYGYCSITVPKGHERNEFSSEYKKNLDNCKIDKDLDQYFAFKFETYFKEKMESQKNSSDVFPVPDMLQDIFGNIYYINPTKLNDYVYEPASMYVISYVLGRVSRYMPDIWMNAIDQSYDTQVYMERLCSLFQRKFPNLILDQLSGCRHSFKSHI